MSFKDKELKRAEPNGINTIDHSRRVNLGINCLEYCVLDTIFQRKKENKETGFINIEMFTLLDPADISIAIEKLESLKIIKEINGKYLVSKLIFEKLDQKDEDKYQDEFDLFWSLPEGFKLNIWPGVKKKSFENFMKARKKHSFDYIMKQRKDYIELLKIQEFRQMMIATRFLNIDNGELTQDFASLVKSLNPVKSDIKEKISMEDKNKLYL